MTAPPRPDLARRLAAEALGSFCLVFALAGPVLGALAGAAVYAFLRVAPRPDPAPVTAVLPDPQEAAS